MAARYGLTFSTYVDTAGSKLVCALLDVPNFEAINHLFNTPENKAAMKLDGVRPHTLRFLITP